MKKLYILLLITFLIISCGKEDSPEPTKTLASPTMNWAAKNVTNDVLEIEVVISSNENLPTGKLEFKIDNTIVDTFTPTKGTTSYTTSYSFEDIDEHSAKLEYVFNDSRTNLSKNKKIKKITDETILKSQNEDWKNYE